MTLIPGSIKRANSQGYQCAEFDQIDWASSTVIFSCTYCLDRAWMPGWVNLSQPAAAINFHLRNLDLLAAQDRLPQRCVWVTPDPSRITVFGPNDSVLRWGTRVEDQWHAQGDTTDWDRVIRLRGWQRQAESYACDHTWLTWSLRTHDLLGWTLVADPDSPDWPQRLSEQIQLGAK